MNTSTLEKQAGTQGRSVEIFAITGLNAFQYPAPAHRRRHEPERYATAAQYREWLRDEFSFRCVYCLECEQWVTRVPIQLR